MAPCTHKRPTQQPPAIDADALKLPKPAAPPKPPHTPHDSNKEAAPKFTAPSVNLGKYDLQFEAGKTSDVNPRTGFDSGETSNLSKATPGKTGKGDAGLFRPQAVACRRNKKLAVGHQHRAGGDQGDACQFGPLRRSPRNATPNSATSTTLNLSIGATLAASPILSARK